jgi:hypothetical protein
MRLKWVVAMALSGMILAAHTTVAIAEEQRCKVVKDRDALDAIMQGIGGAGAFVMLVAPAEVRWIKMAAALGLSSAVWNAAKSYFGYGDEGVEVCVKPPPPGQPAIGQLYLGPNPGLVQHLYDENAMSIYLQSPAGQQLAREYPLDWHDPCIGSSPPSFCSFLGTSTSLPAHGVALAQGQVWDIDWGIGGVQYSAKLTVTSANTFGKFAGYIDVSFLADGRTTKIRENAEISVSGNQVSINCSNVKFLEGSGIYHEDTFEFTMNSLKEGQGTVSDAKVSGLATLRQS